MAAWLQPSPTDAAATDRSSTQLQPITPPTARPRRRAAARAVAKGVHATAVAGVGCGASWVRPGLRSIRPPAQPHVALPRGRQVTPLSVSHPPREAKPTCLPQRLPQLLLPGTAGCLGAPKGGQVCCSCAEAAVRAARGQGGGQAVGGMVA